MTDPNELQDAIEDAEDAFSHTAGTPEFEPGIDSSANAAPGKVQFQKGCQFIEVGKILLGESENYTSVLEHGFSAIERTLEGYLLEYTNDDPWDYTDHTDVYQRSGQLPLDRVTLQKLQQFYDERRTEHYYGTLVTTKAQAESLLRVATMVHNHLADIDDGLASYCNCSTES